MQFSYRLIGGALEDALFDIPSWSIPVGTAVAGFLLAFIWNRWWRKKDDDELSSKRKKDDDELSSKTTIKTHGDRLIVLERRADAHDVHQNERQKAIGKLEAEQSRLEGKVGGLQDFWRSEFGKLREELREDQAHTEQRLTALMSGHQQRVHERLNVIAADQAKMLTEFVDRLVDKHGA